MVSSYSADDVRELAQSTLISVANDQGAPAAARAQAARTLLELHGHLGAGRKPAIDPEQASLATMTRDELLAAVADLRRNRSTPAEQPTGRKSRSAP